MIPAYKKIEMSLKSQIKSGELKAGDRLPTEEKMSITYGVSRGTLKKAVSKLCREGLVVQIPGKGSFVCSEDQAFVNRNGKRNAKSPGKNNKSIAILIPNIAESLYPEIVRGVEDVAHSNGYRILMGSYDANPVKEEKYMCDFLKTDISGMVIVPSFNSYLNKAYKTLDEKVMPFVLADVSVKGVEADLVSSDNSEGAYQGTRYLLERGCRKIAFICGWMTSSSSQERWFGYRKSILESGMKVDESIVIEGDYSEEFGKSTAERLAGSKVDGILSCNEPITNGLLNTLSEMKKSDIRIVSFDEPRIPIGLKNIILIIAQQRYEIGRSAGELLFQRIAGADYPLRKILISTKKILSKGDKQ